MPGIGVLEVMGMKEVTEAGTVAVRVEDVQGEELSAFIT